MDPSHVWKFYRMTYCGHIVRVQILLNVQYFKAKQFIYQLQEVTEHGHLTTKSPAAPLNINLLNEYMKSLPEVVNLSVHTWGPPLVTGCTHSLLDDFAGLWLYIVHQLLRDLFFINCSSTIPSSYRELLHILNPWCNILLTLISQHVGILLDIPGCGGICMLKLPLGKKNCNCQKCVNYQN